MIPVEEARQYLEQLGCPQAAAVLDSHLETAAPRQRTYAELLADLLGFEVAARRDRYLRAQTLLAPSSSCRRGISWTAASSRRLTSSKSRRRPL